MRKHVACKFIKNNFYLICIQCVIVCNEPTDAIGYSQLYYCSLRNAHSLLTTVWLFFLINYIVPRTCMCRTWPSKYLSCL